MENSRPYLMRRSDGFVETIDGLIAVTMRVATGARANNTLFFTFSPGVGKESITVEWNKDDQLSVFPGVVANVLLGRRYAFQPSDAAVIWANDKFGAEPEDKSEDKPEDKSEDKPEDKPEDRDATGQDNQTVIPADPPVEAVPVADQSQVASPDTPPTLDPLPAVKHKRPPADPVTLG